MNKILITIISCLVSVLVFAQPAKQQNFDYKNLAEILFEVESFDFKTIKEGTLATKEFKFKNIGKEPLVLTNVSASCGCVTPEWPKQPLFPGKTSVIKVVYNSQGRPGAFQKTVTITSNAKTSTKVLTIKGNVEAMSFSMPKTPQKP